jgi:hypothetical protein
VIPLALIAASLVAAPNLPAAAADQADLRCIALFAMMAGENAEQQAGTAGAIMFYIGRIEGRGLGLDLDRSLTGAIDELVASRDLVAAEAKRCGGEMVTKGEEIQRIGKAIPADSSQRIGKN